MKQKKKERKKKKERRNPHLRRKNTFQKRRKIVRFPRGAGSNPKSFIQIFINILSYNFLFPKQSKILIDVTIM